MLEYIIPAVTAAVSIGIGAASATGAIGPEKPKPIQLPEPPSRSSAEVAEARRRALLAEGKTRGPGANYLTGGTSLGTAPVAQKYLTGQ